MYSPAMSFALTTSSIKDFLRYTYVIEPDYYVDETLKILHSLQDKGYKIGTISDSWNDNTRTTYNGINVPVTNEVNNKEYLFELQFHTLESYLMKDKLTHKSYEIRQKYESEKNLPTDEKTITKNIYNVAKLMQERLEATIDRPKGINSLHFDEFEYNKKAR